MSDPTIPMTNLSEIKLDQALDTLRREAEALDTPPQIESRLMAALAAAYVSTAPKTARAQPDSTGLRGFARLLGQWFAPGVAIAASVVMASWMMLSPLAQPVDDSSPDHAVAYTNDDANPFIALQSLERIALEPAPRLIAANVPSTSLAAYGVPINPETAGQSVRAEMLVAANGQPLAMRFLP